MVIRPGRVMNLEHSGLRGALYAELGVPASPSQSAADAAFTSHFSQEARTPNFSPVRTLPSSFCLVNTPHVIERAGGCPWAPSRKPGQSVRPQGRHSSTMELGQARWCAHEVGHEGLLCLTRFSPTLPADSAPTLAVCGGTASHLPSKMQGEGRGGGSRARIRGSGSQGQGAGLPLSSRKTCVRTYCVQQAPAGCQHESGVPRPHRLLTNAQASEAGKYLLRQEQVFTLRYVLGEVGHVEFAL